MDSDVTLRSGDLTLRSPKAADVSLVVAAVHASIAELSPWMPWATAKYDTSSARRWIDGELGDVHRFVMIDDQGELIGACGLNGLDELNKGANLGYWVRSDRTGRGHATTSTRLLARYGLDAGLQRLEIVMSTKNLASRRVAERAGARYECIARARLLLHGVPHDAHVFSFAIGDLDKGKYLSEA